MSPPLLTSSIDVRPFAAADAASFQTAVRESAATVGRWMSWCHAAYASDEAKAWIAHCQQQWDAGGDREFGVFDAGSGDVLGGAGINQINRQNHYANLGYWVRASRERQGIASAAALTLAKFAFAELELVRIEIVVRLDNTPSRRVAERIGCRFEGIARNRLQFGGTAHDAAMYSLVPGDLGMPDQSP